MSSLNFWPIIVASIVAFIIGSIWYSPILFGKEWMAHLHMTDKDVADAQARGMTKLYVMQFIITLITFTVMAFGIDRLGVYTTSDGAMFGFIAWIGFIVPMSIGSMLWEKKSLKIALITSISTLLCWIAGGAIIGGWN